MRVPILWARLANSSIGTECLGVMKVLWLPVTCMPLSADYVVAYLHGLPGYSY